MSDQCPVWCETDHTLYGSHWRSFSSDDAVTNVRAVQFSGLEWPPHVGVLGRHGYLTVEPDEAEALAKLLEQYGATGELPAAVRAAGALLVQEETSK